MQSIDKRSLNVGIIWMMNDHGTEEVIVTTNKVKWMEKYFLVKEVSRYKTPTFNQFICHGRVMA